MCRYETEFYELFQRLRALRMFILIFYVAHWLACIWYYIGTLDCNQQHGGLEASCGWVIDGLSSRFENHSMITDPLAKHGADDTYLLRVIQEGFWQLIDAKKQQFPYYKCTILRASVQKLLPRICLCYFSLDLFVEHLFCDEIPH